MNEITIRQLDPTEHEKKGSLLVAQAQEAVIADNDTRELAGTIVAEINSKIALIEMEFDGSDETPGPVKLSHRTWKSAVALRDKALFTFKAAKDIWIAKIKKFEYDTEQARLRESRRLEEQARAKAEKERQVRIAEAKRLGDMEAARNLKAAPLNVIVQAPKTPEVTKAAGLRRSAPDWQFTITNPALVPDRFWIIDESRVKAEVKSRGAQHGIPGVIVFDARGGE